MPIPKDPRWVLLTENGEYSTLGRHREPDEHDIAVVEKALAQVNRSGWIAIMSHSAHHCIAPEIIMVRPLGDPKTTFSDAVDAFRKRP